MEQTEEPAAPEITFSLRGDPAEIRLEHDGFRHPTGMRGNALVYTPYRDVTHLVKSDRVLWIGTRRSVYALARRTFVDPNGPDNLVRALLDRIARQPGGGEQLARMAEIEEMSRTPRPLRATWGLLIVCIVAYAVQVIGGMKVTIVGSFIPALASGGDWWRVITANLLHANIFHLILNGMALMTVGPLVERALGTARTICVLAASGLGAMVASALADSDTVVGVSGVIFGVLAALCWLELHFAERLPASWRVPRRALFWMIALSAVLSLLPFIAGAAHAGGFVAGGIATALLARGPLDARPSSARVRAAALACLAVCALAVGAAAHELLREGNYYWRLAAREAALSDTDPEALNLVAWEIAVDPESPPDLLEKALRLAERAVEGTDRQQAHILDTLGEIHFQLGHREEALAAIDEAILRAPGEDYYREQRRRFLGERDAEDRPYLAPQEEERGGAPEDSGLSV